MDVTTNHPSAGPAYRLGGVPTDGKLAMHEELIEPLTPCSEPSLLRLPQPVLMVTNTDNLDQPILYSSRPRVGRWKARR